MPVEYCCLGKGGWPHKCARAHRPGRVAFGLADRIGDGIICINMVHISPWEATLGLIKGAAAILPPASPFYLYGPYIREGFERRRATRRSTEPSPSQPALGSTRPRGGCRDGAIGWILGSGYHRNARKQSERGVRPGVIGWRHPTPAASSPVATTAHWPTRPFVRFS